MGLSRDEVRRIATSAHLDTRGLSHEDKRAIYNYRQTLKGKGRSPARGTDPKWLLSIRIPSMILGRVHRLTAEAIATGKWPYKTTSDTVTDLLIRGMGTLKGDELVDEMMPYLEIAQAFTRSENHQREMHMLLSKIKTEISELLGIGADKHALSCYGGTMENIEKMQGTVWTKWLMKELRTAFPEMETYYRKGGKLPTTITFHKDRQYKLTMDEDHEERKAERREKDLTKLAQSFGKKR